MRINHNMMAMNTHRQMGTNNLAASKSMEKLSSGYRINRAADDAAGLSISEKMRAQIRGLAQASRNSQDGISLIQTTEGALSSVNDMLVRIKELAVQSRNGIYNDGQDRARLDEELKELSAQITNVSTTTSFNGIKTLSGATSIAIQIGHDKGDLLKLNGAKFSLAAVAGSVGALAIATSNGASQCLSKITSLINRVSAARSYLGANQNRLEYTISNLDTNVENLQASESRIRDVDMAKEMMEFTKNNILQQAATAMLAQANQQPQSVLQLLR